MDTLFTYFVFGLMFSSNAKLTGPVNVGLNAFEFTFPADAAIDNTGGYITFVKFDAESIANMGMDDVGLVQYVKSTFLGTSKPAESTKERFILGNVVVGEIVKTKIPAPSSIEIYVLTLQSGEKMVISFKTMQSLEDEDKEKFISEVCNTLLVK